MQALTSRAGRHRSPPPGPTRASGRAASGARPHACAAYDAGPSGRGPGRSSRPAGAVRKRRRVRERSVPGRSSAEVLRTLFGAARRSALVRLPWTRAPPIACVLGGELVPQVIEHLVHLVHPVAAESQAKPDVIDVGRAWHPRAAGPAAATPPARRSRRRSSRRDAVSFPRKIFAPRSVPMRAVTPIRTMARKTRKKLTSPSCQTPVPQLFRPLRPAFPRVGARRSGRCRRSGSGGARPLPRPVRRLARGRPPPAPGPGPSRTPFPPQPVSP